jgi:hypothetical protein
MLVLPLCAQDRLYPVRPDRNSSDARLTEDHATVVVEKSFAYRLTVGFPSDDKLWFSPTGKLKMAVLWVKIENISDRPVELNISKFTATDDQGTAYPILSPDEAFRRIVALNRTTSTLLDKTINNASLGRAGNTRNEEQYQHDASRYSLQNGQIPAHTFQDGLIYFETPESKKYPLTVVLGDLWSKPLVFSKSKPK